MKGKMKFIMPFVALFAAATMFGCGLKTNTNTANVYVTKASYYVGLAETMVAIAKVSYSSNAKVTTALKATEDALKAVKTSLTLISAGLDKDYTTLAAKTEELVKAVIELMAAIKDAAAAKTSA